MSVQKILDLISETKLTPKDLDKIHGALDIAVEDCAGLVEELEAALRVLESKYPALGTPTKNKTVDGDTCFTYPCGLQVQTCQGDFFDLYYRGNRYGLQPISRLESAGLGCHIAQFSKSLQRRVQAAKECLEDQEAKYKEFQTIFQGLCQ